MSLYVRAIALILPLFVSLLPEAQEENCPRPVYCDGTLAGYLYQQTSADQEADCFYTTDTFTLFSRNIVVRSDVYVRAVYEEDLTFAPCWQVYTEPIHPHQVRLVFQSIESGLMYWLELHQQGSEIYLREALEIWPSSYFNLYTGEADGTFSLMSTSIAHAYIQQPVKGDIILPPILSERHHCPRKLSYEECIRCIKRKHEFRVKDFEEEGGDTLPAAFRARKVSEVAQEPPA